MRQQKAAKQQQKRFDQELAALKKENSRLRNLFNRAGRPHEDVVHREDIPPQETIPSKFQRQFQLIKRKKHWLN
jgi:hypothetical protein